MERLTLARKAFKDQQESRVKQELMEL